MNDHLEATHSDSASPYSQSDESVEAKSTSLELRINRLEDAVAHLQDTQSLEARVVERVTERLQSHEATNARTVAGVIVDASRHLLPALGSNASSDNAGTRGRPPNGIRLCADPGCWWKCWLKCGPSFECSWIPAIIWGGEAA